MARCGCETRKHPHLNFCLRKGRQGHRRLIVAGWSKLVLAYAEKNRKLVTLRNTPSLLSEMNKAIHFIQELDEILAYAEG